ncbi:hypothetical protein [Marimonas arenosa]|uniref:Uncharacterized protein n=1 Tax=Marimonas arenosa TaxID=1795305 RepID=A0AAE4B4L2_9RHOB|nr:hypothetical protein [Marimonas arenosa]MDQ2090335.1 hypothetical protein [Marimonas arenosa]
MFKRLIAVGLGLGALVTSFPAHAEDCAARAHVVSRLQHDYAEQLTAGGLHDTATMIEVWASPETGTFTVITTRADGMSCILATGTDWIERGPDAMRPGIEG